MSLLLPETGLVIWMLIAFGIVFFILAKWGWPVITGMAEKRANFISESLESAKEANKQLANIKTESQQIINEAREQQAKLLKDAATSRDKIINDAKSKALVETNKMIEDAKNEIQIERENMLNELRIQTAELSVSIAEKIVRKELNNDKAQMFTINKMLDEIEVKN
ncbi:MAG: F0F1 ATP synthase subunit B [Bacteroidales bacterium]|jgi:F-type H+-transporting ATPase subunit b|nr:F0F1 ATP synthase subunit B [Bacteroidales bacterium]MDD2204379.1 F0F1 ATP synthase subunit B [Bacteroidales bacterium]MDD3152434.1 F0F1 ATP synthase subunit B [Bacteroidales bacterium]MDD3913849.1 F0F1 ATP synthase subunit B [Bacteroidales bacterium]MDD4634520.1 F0F1 ATP synthase subunit B [Bacteroidales bacterium]